MDDTASKIHENRMAVAGACGVVALLLFWFAVGWGFLGSLLAGIVVFALLLLLIGWIGAGEAEAARPVARKPLAASETANRVTTVPPSTAPGGGATGATGPVTGGAPSDAGARVSEPGPVATPAPAPVAEARKPAPEPEPASEMPKPAPVADAPDTAPASEPATAPAVAPASPAVPVATVASETGTTEAEDARPATLDAPRDGTADDLKRIKGIGPKLERLCNELGVWHLDQIASWSDAEVAWVDEHLEGFRGRVRRDDWVAQARTLGSGEGTEFSRRVDEGGVY